MKAGRIFAIAGIAALGIAAGLALSRAKRTALKAVMALTGDWEKQLKAEHQAIKRVLKALAEAEPVEAVKRTSLLAAADEALTRHALEEEKVIYPALKAAGAGGAAEVFYAQHGEIKMLIRNLQELAVEDPAWTEAAAALRRLFQRHVKGVEELYPLLHDLGDKSRNRTLTTLVRREAVRAS